MSSSQTHTNYYEKEGVIYSVNSARYSDFENNYLEVRADEKRVLSDEMVKQLPFVPLSHPDFYHWQIRRKNLNRFLRYLRTRPVLNILDIGCGNGFLSSAMAKIGHKVTGVDVNALELSQAARVFAGKGIRWFCADIFDDDPDQKYDLVVFCCSIQYFSSLSKTIRRAKDFLNDGGEIHIIDSPFYRQHQLSEAIRRSNEYYSAKGRPGMIQYYHHHSVETLQSFKPVFRYKPSLFRRLMKDSPFPWIIIKK